MNKKLLILLGIALAALPCACNKAGGDSAPTRSEFIKVYETSEEKPVDSIQVPFDGVQDGQIHVLSNVELDWKYMVNQTLSEAEMDPEWFLVKGEPVLQPDDKYPYHYVVTYDAKSILVLNSLERRSGKLSFSCPSASLGKFLSVRQGYSRRFVETFNGETDGVLTITGNQTYTTKDYPVLNTDYYDYISFNAWAETENEFRSKNITLDITVSGGHFHDTGLATYRINVPIGTGPDQSNLKYLLLVGNGERMSAKTHFTFSAANDDLVFIHIDNFAAYEVSLAEMI